MKKIFSFAFTAVLILNLSACSSAPTEDMETVIQKAWEKIAQQQADRQTSNIEVSGNLNIDAEGNKGQIEGKGMVQSDATDMKNPKFAANMELKGSGDVEGQSGKVDLKGEIRMLNKKMFVNLDNLNIDVGDAGTNMMANMMMNQVGNQVMNQAIPTGNDMMKKMEEAGHMMPEGTMMKEEAK